MGVVERGSDARTPAGYRVTAIRRLVCSPSYESRAKQWPAATVSQPPAGRLPGFRLRECVAAAAKQHPRLREKHVIAHAFPHTALLASLDSL